MKQILLIVAIMVSCVSIAQDAYQKEVGEFSEIKVYDLIEVNLIKSTENKISISGKNSNQVEFVNKDGTLKIRMGLEKIFNGSDTKVDIYYTNIDIIDANEGSYIRSNDVIKQYEISLNAQEGSLIKVEVDVNYLNIRTVTGASVHVSGKSKHQDVSIYTGGVYKAEKLDTEYTEVSIRAAGDAYVKASNTVNAKVRAGGNIYIYGKPEKVVEDNVLGGVIKQMND